MPAFGAFNMSGKLKLIIVLFCLIAAPLSAQARPMSTAELKNMCSVGPIEACEIYLRGAFEALDGLRWICATGVGESPESLRDIFLAGTGMVGAKADSYPAINTIKLYLHR
jgi:hypothetical protein